MKRTRPPAIETFPAAKQRRLDELLEKNSEGTILPKEKAKLEQLVLEAEHLMLANAKRLAEFREHDSPNKRPDGVPVTVWVHPERTSS